MVRRSNAESKNGRHVLQSVFFLFVILQSSHVLHLARFSVGCSQSRAIHSGPSCARVVLSQFVAVIQIQHVC